MRRCLQLSGGRTGEFFMQWVVQLSFGLVFALCFWVGNRRGDLGLVQERSLTWERPVLTEFRAAFDFSSGSWIAIAFFGVARFLIYIDQRIRSEGWELRLRLQAVGPGPRRRVDDVDPRSGVRVWVCALGADRLLGV